MVTQSHPCRALTHSRNMTLLIFDCDGVLVDSELLANAALAELMSTLGHPMTTEQAVKIFTGLRLRDVLSSAEALLSFPIPADLGASAGEGLLERFGCGRKTATRDIESAGTIQDSRRV